MLFDTPRLVSIAVILGLVARQLSSVETLCARRKAEQASARDLMNALPF